MGRVKIAFLVVFYIILSGCASNAKYDKMMSLDHSTKTGVTSIEKGELFVVFDIKKDKTFKIISVNTSINDEIVNQINANNKDSNNNLRSCIQLNPSAVCTSYIEPNIYLKKKSTGVLGAIVGVALSPISLTIDALDVATGQKPTSTKNSFVKNATNKSLVEKVASHIDHILYEEYNTSKQSGSLSKLLSKYDLPTIQQRENDKIKARRIAREKAEKIRKEKIRLKKKAKQERIARERKARFSISDLNNIIQKSPNDIDKVDAAKKRIQEIKSLFNGYEPKNVIERDNCHFYYPKKIIDSVLIEGLSLKDWNKIKVDARLCRKGFLFGKTTIKFSSYKNPKLYIELSGKMRYGIFEGKVKYEYSQSPFRSDFRFSNSVERNILPVNSNSDYHLGK